MIVNRPEDRVKVMVLIPSVIAVLLYFIFGVLPMMAKMRQDASPAAAPAEPTAASAQTAAGPSETAAAAPQTNSPIFADMAPPDDTTNDPFKPPVPPPPTTAELLAANKGSKPPVSRNLSPATVSNLTLSPLPGGKLGGPTISPAVTGATPTQTAPSTLTLQGVVIAERSVGVFRSGEETFYKHVGDTVVDNLVLRRVTDGGVVLGRGKQLFALEIGHSDMNPSSGNVATPVKSTFAFATQPAKPIASVSQSGVGAPQFADATAPTSTSYTAEDQTSQGLKATPSPAAHIAGNIAASGSNRNVAGNSDRAAGSTGNSVSTAVYVASVPAEDLHEQIQQASMIVHHAPRHRHRPVRHHRKVNKAHPRPARRAHHKPRAKSFMASPAP